MFNKPFISDSDPFIPGKPPFSPAKLDELKKKYDSPAPQPQGPNKRRLADVINDEAPVAKPDPVAKPEPVVVSEKKIGATIIRKVKREKR